MLQLMGKGVFSSSLRIAWSEARELRQTDPLMTSDDLSTVWIVGEVFEKDIANMQPGSRVAVSADPFPGQN